MPDDVYGLGIETSCDETGIALIKNGREILANPVYSQVDLHRLYGGVVPEMASRLHLEKFPGILTEILSQFPDILGKLSYISVTTQPGLVGSLVIGYYIGLALKTITGVPLIPVNHLEAHFYANTLANRNLPATSIAEEIMEYPFLGLLLSGGNSAIFLVEGPGKLKILGDTLDDAAGEAFDKAASMLGLDYPGGPVIEKLAQQFTENTPNLEKELNPLPIILKDQPGTMYNFSFSGIKTALYYYIQNASDPDAEHLAWCLQERIFEIVLRNVKHAVKNTGIRKLISAGGVMANQTLKGRLQSLSEKMEFTFQCPPAALCTDNGAMVGALGYRYFLSGDFGNYEKTLSSKMGFL